MSKSDTHSTVKPTHIGGQALLEGIMMRGKYNWVVAVRKPDGSIYTEEHDLPGSQKKNWKKWPIVRGCVALGESLMLSFKALEIAATHAFSGESKEQKVAEAEELRESGDVAEEIAADVIEDVELSPKEIAFALIGGIGLAILLFVIMPAFLTNLIVGSYGKGSLTWNIVDGLLRVLAFIAYIWAISRMSDVKRMFSYHGAEHKLIHTHEHGLDLTVDNARSFSTLHVRCGTAFMLMAMLVAILVFTLVPVRGIIDSMGVTNSVAIFALVIVSRIILLPLVAGISYEITVKWAGNHSDNPFVKLVLWPGLQLQKLTTNEPDDDMLEIAIAATDLVLAREAAEEAAGTPVPELSPLEEACLASSASVGGSCASVSCATLSEELQLQMKENENKASTGDLES